MATIGRFLGLLVLSGAPALDALAESPEETYRRYLAAIVAAERLEDIYAFLTEDRIATLIAGLEGAELAGQDPRVVESTTLTLLKVGAEAPAMYKEYVIDTEASVVVERAETTIEVLMILEDGRWKIADERFIQMPVLQ